MQQYDVVVVGKGNAALCAALTARDAGVSVAMLEAAAVDESGGNSRFAGGVMRFAYSTVEELQKVIDDFEVDASPATPARVTAAPADRRGWEKMWWGLGEAAALVAVLGLGSLVAIVLLIRRVRSRARATSRA